MLKPDSLRGSRPFGVATASLLADYVTLTKPPIILLLLITALGGDIPRFRGVTSGKCNPPANDRRSSSSRWRRRY